MLRCSLRIEGGETMGRSQDCDFFPEGKRLCGWPRDDFPVESRPRPKFERSGLFLFFFFSVPISVRITNRAMRSARALVLLVLVGFSDGGCGWALGDESTGGKG